MWRRLPVLCFLLFLMACQPYVDHEEGDSFRAVLPDFGPKRQLELKRLDGDQRSLLFVFNQPLRRPEDAGPPPFQATLSPPAVVAETAYEGVAGVRITFAQPLPSASDYTVFVPAGWRAATGVSLLSPIKRAWSTPRPALREIRVQGHGPQSPRSASEIVLPVGKGLELGFNQPVAMGSVKSALRWQSLSSSSGSSEESWTLTSLADASGVDDHTRYLFSPAEGSPAGTHSLSLGPGVKGLEGPLRSEQPQEFLVRQPMPLLYQGERRIAPDNGRIILPFSAPVKPAELARCLVTVPLDSRPTIHPHPDRPTHLVLGWKGQSARRLILLPGLTSEEGDHLAEEVSIELPSGRAEAPPDVGMVPISLGSSRGFPGGEGRAIRGWSLTLEQALAVSQIAEQAWSGREPLKWERVKPLFESPKAASGAPFLPKKGGGFGFFLLRWVATDGRVERALAVGSELVPQTISTEQAVQVKIVSLSTGSPVADCQVWLRGMASTESAVLRTDAQGEATLAWPGKAADRLFLVARKGRETTFTPLAPRPPASSPLPGSFLVIDPPFRAPGQSLDLRGFTWARLESGGVDGSQARLSLLDEDGKEHGRVEVEIDEQGFLKSVGASPNAPGLYRARLSMPEAGVSEAFFRVCPEASDGESYSLKVEPAENGYKATLAREGARHRGVGVRAFLLPPAALRRETEGWTPVSGQRPSRHPLPVTPGEGGEFSLVLAGDSSIGGTLLVEAYDLEQPDLVLHRVHLPVDPTNPYLDFSLAQSTPGSVVGAVEPRAVGWDGDPPTISAKLMWRAPGSLEWKEADARATLVGPGAGEPWSPRLHQPGDYRLSLRAVLPNGPTLESTWEKYVSARELGDEGLTVEPKPAFPGDDLVATLSAADQADDVWLDFQAAGAVLGGWRSLGEDGRLQPLQIPFVRDSSWKVSTRSQARPSRGRPRARWIERSTPVPLAPITREARLSLLMERADRVKTAARVGGDLVATVEKMGQGSGWTGLLAWRPALSEWVLPRPPLLASFLGQPAETGDLEEGYPLLPEGGFVRGSIAGWSLDEPAELKLKAPEKAGSYQWWTIARDSVGRFGFAEVKLDVEEVSSWRTVGPWGVRPGDEFDAGVEFLTGPEQTAPVGLTATALGGDDLLPSGYIRTAGVAKPGGSYLLKFHYDAGSDVKEKISLAWEIGHGGALHTQKAEVDIFETPPVPRGQGVAVLKPGVSHRVAVSGPMAWRLMLQSPASAQAETLLSVYGPRGSLGKVHLRPGADPVMLQGAGPGTVGIQSLSGPTINYEMFRLRPDDGNLSPWGSRVYLFRSLLDASGKAVERARQGQRYRVLLDLVNPAPLGRLQVQVPLPGGTRPLGLETAGRPVAWREESGAVIFEVSDLEPGEFRWDLEVEAVAAGEYLWPTARATGPDGSVQALSGSDTLTID